MPGCARRARPENETGGRNERRSHHLRAVELEGGGQRAGRTRIQQVKADIAAHQEPATRPGRGLAQSPWQSIKADAAAGTRDLQDRIDHKRHELDVKSAERDAEDAGENALDALAFARWAVEQAEVAVLDAVDTRAWADERAAAWQTS